MGKGKKSLVSDGFSKFDGLGVDFKCKLIGVCDVTLARGDDVCQEAISKLKQHALKMNKEKKHKQKITVNITLKGIRLLDDQTERIEHGHPIQRISYISHDKDDKRTFGYIVGTKEGYKLFAIRTPKEAELITKTLKELFQEVFDRHQEKRSRLDYNQNEADQSVEPAEEATEKVSEDRPEEDEKMSMDDAFLNWDTLNEQIQVMQKDGGISRADSCDMLADINFSSNDSSKVPNPFGDDAFVTTSQNDSNVDLFANTPLKANSQDTDLFGSAPLHDIFSPKPTERAQSSDDLFDLVAPPPTPHKKLSSTATDIPLLMSDPFAELKKNINDLHKQNQQHPQFSYQGSFPSTQGFPPSQQQGAFPPQTGFQQNSFSQQQKSFNLQSQQPMAGNNPFGASPTYSNPPLPPRPAANNPFFHQPAQPQQEASTGWTVNRPTPAPRQDLKKAQPANFSGSDPFAFLDNQTGTKGATVPTSRLIPNSVTNGTTSSSSANSDLFDLLG